MRVRSALVLWGSALLITALTSTVAGPGPPVGAAAPESPTNPTEIEALDGWVYFSAETPATGAELWRSDGITIELVSDIVEGPVGSEPTGLTAWQDWVYFAASTPDAGTELWRSDGTTTELYADIIDGPDSSWPRDFVASDGWLNFVANTTGILYLFDIVRTDGSTFEIAPSDVSGVGEVFFANDLVESAGWLYFACETALDFKLCRTDFVTTELVADISGDSENGEWPRDLAVFEGWVYFSADDWDDLGRELWRSNGVTTELVADINPMVEGSGDPGMSAGMTDLNGWLYFDAYPMLSELWRTNGTVTERVVVVDFGYARFEVLDGTLYFDSDERTALGSELWSSNGVDEAHIVSDIVPGPEGSDPSDLTAMDGWLYFSANTPGTSVRELWRSNGSVTHRVGGDHLFTGFVDSSRVLGPKWTRTFFTPSAAGEHVLLLEWATDADLRFSVKQAATGALIGVHVGAEQPKNLGVDLADGVEYQVAVWAKRGAADFAVSVMAPPPRVGEVIDSRTVDAARVAGPKWVRTFYTAAMSGDHQFVLDWNTDANLRISFKLRADGSLIARDSSQDRPKVVTLDLESGVEYQVAVWSVAGAGDFTVTVYPPPHH